MRQLERVALWAVIAGLGGWHLGRATAAPTGVSHNAALDFLDARLDLIEDWQAWQTGAVSVHDPLVSKAEEFEKEAKGAGKELAEQKTTVAQMLRDRAKRYEAAAKEERKGFKEPGK